ncbi:DUF6896 domain-containing protein [Pseudoalteromonas rubra]|nr:hypothetical protein [Pseudoalteromonas rubra]
MPDPIRRYYISSFFLPPVEKLIRLVERERHLVLAFPSWMSYSKREKLIVRLRRELPENYSVFAAGSRKYWSYVTIMQVISKSEIYRITPEIKHAASEFRKQSEWLARQITELNDIPLTELWDKSDEIQLFPDGWRCYHHGAHFYCENIDSGQVIEVPIWYGEEFGVLDPYFFAEFIDTTQSLTMPEGIIDWYHDMSRVMDVMVEMGLFKKITGTKFGAIGIVVN